MKKVLIAFIVLIGFNVHSMAQAVKKADDKVKTVPAVVKPSTPAKVVELPKTPAKTSVVEKQKPVATTPAVNKPKAVTTNAPVVLKKDGTPDKRFKTTTGPTKKDGTPDRRFKKNKKGESK